MKTLLLILATASVARAQTVSTIVCRSQCIGIDRSTNSLSFHGHLTSTGGSRLRSWQALNESCLRKAKRAGTSGLLASAFFMDSDLSWSTASSHSVRYTSFSVTSSSSYSFFQNDRLSVEVQLNESSKACSEELVDEWDLQPVYDGDQPIFG